MPNERGSAGNTMTAPSGMQQWEQELADEIPSAPPLLSNRVFWRRVELALRSSAAVAAVLAVNYLTDQTWLPAGNLAAAFAVVTCGGGSIGSALNLANIEAMLQHADATGRVNFQTFKRIVLHGLRTDKNAAPKSPPLQPTEGE